MRSRQRGCFQVPVDGSPLVFEKGELDDQRGVSIRKKYDPSVLCCSVAIKAAEENRGVSCESFHAEYTHSRASGCGQPLWLSGISFCFFFPDLVVDLLACLVITHLLCLRRARLAPHRVAVSGSMKSCSSSHLLPGCRWSGRLFLVLRSWESLYCLRPVAFPLVLRQFFKNVFFGGSQTWCCLLPPYQYFIFFFRQTTSQRSERRDVTPTNSFLPWSRRANTESKVNRYSHQITPAWCQIKIFESSSTHLHLHPHPFFL